LSQVITQGIFKQNDGAILHTRLCDHQVTINIGADSSSSYVRRLGVFDTTMVLAGGIIGAGIFLNPAIVAQRVHPTAFILAAWIIGGAITLIGALTFAELGARRPQAGGGYIYLTGDLIGPG
jgi:APA family basic amino acid/polyamine antiporter